MAGGRASARGGFLVVGRSNLGRVILLLVLLPAGQRPGAKPHSGHVRCRWWCDGAYWEKPPRPVSPLLTYMGLSAPTAPYPPSPRKKVLRAWGHTGCAVRSTVLCVCPATGVGTQQHHQGAPLHLATHEGTWGSVVLWNVLTGARGRPSSLASCDLGCLLAPLLPPSWERAQRLEQAAGQWAEPGLEAWPPVAFLKERREGWGGGGTAGGEREGHAWLPS